MADASFAQTSFLGGEWSQFTQGRFDKPEYRTAMSVCLNGFPLEQGAWVRRPGTRHVFPARGGASGRVRSFDFKQSQPYVIIFTAGYLRFITGSSIVTTNDDQAVSAISSANPAEVTTSAAHGWATGNAVRFANCGTNTPLLHNRTFTITVTSPAKFTIVDELTGANIDGSTLGALGGSTTVQRPLEVASPYTDLLWQNVRIVQTELQAVLLHPAIPPQVLTATAPGGGQTFYSFTLAQANLLDGPYLDPFTNGVQVTPSATNGIITLSLSFPTYASAKAYSKGDFVTYSSVNYQSIVDQNVGNQPDTHGSQWAAVNAGIAIGPNGFVGTDVGRYIRIQDSANNLTWGKITSLANLISASLAGSVNIGTMTSGGGLAAAFDSVTAQAASASASFSNTVDPTKSYVGKNYSGASTQKIGFATFWPSSDLGGYAATKTYTTTTTTYQWADTGGGVYGWVVIGQVAYVYTVPTAVSSVSVNLRAKQTAPANSADGTLLGSSPVSGTSPITILSNDQSTAWNYVWLELVVSGVNTSVPAYVDTRPGPIIGAQGYVQSSVLSYFSVYEYCAEAQFFNPPGTGTGNAVQMQILGNALADTTVRPVWQFGAFSNTTGWPSCGTYHEGRLWLGGAISNRLDGSVSNQQFNFALTNTTGTVLASSAIAATFNSPDVNAINWVVPDQLGLIVGTQAGDWLVQATAANNPLTPSSMQAHRYSKLGCANIDPCRADRTLIVVQRFARKLYEYFADVFSGRLSAKNVTFSARHLTAPGIAEICYQQELSPIIWSRCTDGSWFGITYKRESLTVSQAPDFSGASRHTLGSGRVVESITVGPSSGGTTDSLAMITNDPSTGIRHVEIMTNIMDEGSSISQAWFLDNAVVPASVNAGSSNCVLSGLWHLNGQVVTVFAGGIDCGDWAVANGQITLTYGDGISGGTGSGLFTQAFAQAASFVVGFTYTSQGQIVRPATPQESGARNGPALGKKRRSMQFSALLYNTASISFGTTFSKMQPAIFRNPDNSAYAAGRMFSGVYWTSLQDDYSFDGGLCWQITRPYPASVVAVEQFISTQDK